MIIFLTIVHFIVCLILIVVILLQAGKGHGLAGGGLGAESSNSIFGTNTATMLTKLTTAAAIAFIITSLSLDVLNSRRDKSLIMDSKDFDLPRELAELAEKQSQKAEKEVATLEENTEEAVGSAVNEATEGLEEAGSAAENRDDSQ
jgi:preprotein translocase subunit SecG